MLTAHIGCGIPEPLVGSLKEGTEVSLTIWTQVQAGIQMPEDTGGALAAVLL